MSMKAIKNLFYIFVFDVYESFKNLFYILVSDVYANLQERE